MYSLFRRYSVSSMRILVLSANYGAGHVKAAEAVIESLYSKVTNIEISHLDFSAFLGKPLNSVVENTYIEMIKHTPKLWGKFYYRTSSINSNSLIQRLLNGLGKKEFVKLIYSYRPDVIISTYPTIAGVLAQLRLNKIIQVPLVTIVTDYALHNQWVHQGVDLYLVGCQDVFKGLVNRGIDPSRIKITGIPVHPKFELYHDRQVLLRKFGLLPNLPTFLVMGGAYGILGEMKRICNILTTAPTPVQTLLVCGRNEKLFKSSNNLVINAPNPIKRFTFVNNVEEFMTVADLIVTKAGGLTVSEALTKGLPLLIHKPIPGQENENAKYIKAIHAGIVTKTIKEFQKNVDYILQNPYKLKEMSKAARLATPTNSADQVVDHVLKLVQYGHRVEWTS